MAVAVVGAGIAGLAAAFELRRAGVEVILLEQERRAGGVIVTERPETGRWIVEGGPDGFLASDPELPALARELGIADRIIGQTARGAQAWTGSRLEPLADGEAAELLQLQTRSADLAAGFRTFQGGMVELVEPLAAGPRYRAGVTAIAGGRGTGYRLSLTGGATLEAEGLILALPAYAAGRLLLSLDAPAARSLLEITYHPSLTVSLAYRRDQVGGALDGTGFVMAPDVVSPLRACTFASSKFRGRAPEGHVLLRAFLAWGADEAAPLAHRALVPILGITGEPLWARVFSWPRGLPQYRPGHDEHVAWVRDRLRAFPSVALAGAGYDGPGVSACVRSGRVAGRAALTPPPGRPAPAA